MTSEEFLKNVRSQFETTDILPQVIPLIKLIGEETSELITGLLLCVEVILHKVIHPAPERLVQFFQVIGGDEYDGAVLETPDAIQCVEETRECDLVASRVVILALLEQTIDVLHGNPCRLGAILEASFQGSVIYVGRELYICDGLAELAGECVDQGGLAGPGGPVKHVDASVWDVQ
jgi:hypothetical protein